MLVKTHEGFIKANCYRKLQRNSLLAVPRKLVGCLQRVDMFCPLNLKGCSAYDFLSTTGKSILDCA